MAWLTLVSILASLGKVHAGASSGSLGQAQSIGHFPHPTPGIRNTEPLGLPAAPPTFSHESGQLTSPVSLALSGPSPTAEIRFTLDGTEPGGSSTRYTIPLTISSSTRVKARVYDPL